MKKGQTETHEEGETEADTQREKERQRQRRRQRITLWQGNNLRSSSFVKKDPENRLA